MNDEHEATITVDKHITYIICGTLIAMAAMIGTCDVVKTRLEVEASNHCSDKVSE